MYYITILLYFRIAWITFWCFQLHILISYAWKICLPELFWQEILYGHGLLDRFNSDECYARFRKIEIFFFYSSPIMTNVHLVLKMIISVCLGVLVWCFISNSPSVTIMLVESRKQWLGDWWKRLFLNFAICCETRVCEIQSLWWALAAWMSSSISLDILVQ